MVKIEWTLWSRVSRVSTLDDAKCTLDLVGVISMGAKIQLASVMISKLGK